MNEKKHQGAVDTAAMARHGFVTKRALGQHLLKDEGVLSAILEATELQANDDMGVLEVGPGTGVLTTRLAQRAARMAAVELDGTAIPLLEEALALQSGGARVALIHGDILRVDLEALAAGPLAAKPFRIVSNLPYQVTTLCLERFLLSALPWCSMVVMVQKEAGARLCAAPGGKDYGALAILSRCYGEWEPIVEVPPHCFLPPPHVDSVVLRLRRAHEPEGSPRALYALVKALLSQRRKTLPNALAASPYCPQYSREDWLGFLEGCDIDPGRRAETMTQEEWERCAAELEARRGQDA